MTANQPQKPKKPRPIDGIVGKVMSSMGHGNSYAGWSIVAKWAEIVGPEIAKRSRAFKYHEGTLFVAVPDAAWRHNLMMERDQILAKIHGLSHGRAIKDLHLVQGEKG